MTSAAAGEQISETLRRNGGSMLAEDLARGPDTGASRNRCQERFLTVRASLRGIPLRLAICVSIASTAAQAQPTPDSSATPAPAWRDSARYGGGPSVGAPPSDYTGATPPTTWCLRATRRAPGDFGVTGQSWTDASRGWLREILSDSTDHGAGWRKVLGDAPRLAPRDSIVQIFDEDVCRAVAQLLNREVLGWRVGPPPVVIFQVHDYLIAYPSNARRGEFGLAIGMTLDHKIRGVAVW